MLNSTFSRQIAAGSVAGSMATSNTQNVMPATETFSMQGICTNVPQPKVFTGCIKPPESTSTLAGRLAGGQTSRSTKLEERVKKQSKILSDLALEVHYGSKVCKISIVNVCCFVHAGHSPNLFHCILCYLYTHGFPENILILILGTIG